MNKFRHYKCDVCNKETDVDNNITHVFIDKCTLTAGCRGRLRLVSEKNSKDNIVNFVEASVNPTRTSLVDVSIPALIDLSTAKSANALAIGVKSTGGSFAANATARLWLSEILNQDLEYQEYQFNLSVPVNAISGKDSSIDQRVLIFDTGSNISVSINGQEVDPALYVAENNSIRFLTQINYGTYASSSIFVKILVYAPVTTVSRELVFNRNVQNLSTSAWSNIEKVKAQGEEYTLFTCTDLSTIDLKTRMNVSGLSVAGATHQLGDAFFLLAQDPFGVLDRIETRVIRLSALVNDANYLRYNVIANENKVLVTSNSISDVFPKITVDVNAVFSIAAEIDTVGDVGLDTSLNRNITNNNEFILGPV